MKKHILTGALLSGLLFAGCQDLFEPAPETFENKETMYDAPLYALGLLDHAYLRLPSWANDYSYVFSDMATDDAVAQNAGDAFRRLATGQWSASFGSDINVWTNHYNAIAYLNELLAAIDDVNWADDPEAFTLFSLRMEGEARALRALFYTQLLQAHAGPVGGELMGVQLFLDPMDQTADLNIPRSDFRTCIEQIYADLTRAEECLPLDYNDLTGTENPTIPAKYAALNVKTIGTYDRAMGMRFRGRISGRIAKGIRAQVDLLAASPAFSGGSGVSWATAARSAAALLNANGGLGGFSQTGTTWYTNTTELNALANGANPAEILWRRRALKHSGRTSTIEYANYPPTLFGQGRVNPTENLVQAFPMQNGYPIDDAANSGFDPANPYRNRDPRLAKYIVYHGSTAGPRSSVISIETGQDAVNAMELSTRTGYYMRKLLNNDTNQDPNGFSSMMAYVARMRYTEFYLGYAEAANEAWGPTADPDGNGYSAYDVIKAIRQRAGIGTNGEDPYLESAKNDPAAMRELIRNERRLELCFEGFRFWDLRRWMVPMDELTAPALGITVNGGQVSQPAVVEQRVYQSHMYYGPIPYAEVLKFSELKQNDNWR